ncbi:MAG: radical SAM family heme chaperone HemW [Oscillospiraceae bacterium]
MDAIYIHIPYCMSKCNYCDFYSQGRKTSVPQEYVNAVLREIEYYKKSFDIRADSLYFGGGTPSLMSPRQVKAIIDAVSPRADAEITLEANPECVTAQSLDGFKKAGINRISFGVQTANAQSLKRLGRAHSTEQSLSALKMAKDAGFTNISGDIMLALPSYSYKELDDTLAILANGGCTHISSYLLKIEPNTVFGKRPPMDMPKEDEAADYYLYCVNALEQLGYHQYEISNFAKDGCESRHNLVYWRGGDYLGIGPAAHSCVNGKRFYYPSSTNAFINGDIKTVADGVYDAEDYIMLRLRLIEGLNLAELNERYNIDLISEHGGFIKKLCETDRAVCKENILTLTPKGMLVQNSILAELI